ncbi:hypothetical protein JCM19233_4925 [Vibrio astriarenae]|nr:hypothetical protein JCM19233_4925 [Vibrio sp. C7]
MQSTQRLDPIIRMKELTSIIGVSRGTIYNLIKKGDFPQSIQLGTNSVGFLQSEVLAWREERMNQRNEVA